jgi:hypothetical protein
VEGFPGKLSRGGFFEEAFPWRLSRGGVPREAFPGRILLGRNKWGITDDRNHIRCDRHYAGVHRRRALSTRWCGERSTYAAPSGCVGIGYPNFEVPLVDGGSMV